MRYYLDTNIVIFMLTDRRDEFTVEVRGILAEYGNTLLVSSVVLHELLHLCQIGKLNDKREKKPMAPGAAMKWLEDTGITVEYAGAAHYGEYASLPLYEAHRDPFDRLIIAQAISDRVPLVSSDRKFSLYERHGLRFVYNKR